MLTLTEKIGKRVLELRKKKKSTLEELASKLGVSRQSIQSWEKGEAAPKIERLEDVAAVLETTLKYLVLGDSDGEVVSSSNKIQLIGWDLKPTENTQYYYCPIDCSVKTLVLRVAGESMYNPHGKPSFNDGDLIFIDPVKELKNGSIVLVQLPDNKQAIFRQIIIEGGVKFLKALNPAWPIAIMQLPENASIIGCVIARSELLD